MNQTTTRQVLLQGITPIMFDRYSGSNDDQLSWKDKVYTSIEDGKTLVLPSLNIMSFLSSQNAESAPKKLAGKKWKPLAAACLTYVSISPVEIPILREGKTMTFDDSGIYCHKCVARVKKGNMCVPSPKERPVLNTPWEMKLELTFFESKELSENTLKNLFEVGGIQVGFGTYRPLFGKFIVKEWK